MPAAVLQAGMTYIDVVDIKTYFCKRIFCMTSSLSGARVRVATTACVYFHRFYAKHSFLEHDPRTLAPACVYIAGANDPTY
jgi:cyclin-C